MAMLEQNEFVRELHQKYVMSGVMAQDDFWRDLNLDQHDIEDTVGPPSKLTLLTKIHNPKTDVWEISFNYEMGEILKRLYPQLAEAFTALVPTQLKEKQFWEQFVKFQDIHQTQVIGGLNPMRLPQKFLESLQTPFQQDKEQREKGLRSKDLQLILQAESQKLPAGYGVDSAQKLMDLDQVLMIDTRETTGSASKAERLMKYVNAKSQKILKDTESSEGQARERSNESISSLSPRIEPVPQKKKQRQFLSNQAVKANHTEWQAFCKLVNQEEVERLPLLKPKSVRKQVVQLTEAARVVRPAQVPEAVQKTLKKYFKSVSSVLRLFYAVFPISKRHKEQKLASLEKCKEEIDQLKVRLDAEREKPAMGRYRGLFDRIFCQIHKAEQVYEAVLQGIN